VLAAVNRRVQPALVNGAWDFLGLLFAVSGVLLFALPVLVFGIFRQMLDEQLFGDKGPSPEGAGHVQLQWRLAWGAWWALVLGGCALLVWLRRRKTVVYNVAPADFDRAFEQALARLQLTATRSAGRTVIVPAPRPDDFLEAVTAAPPPHAAAPALRVLPPSGAAVVDVEAFPSLYNVTLHWRDAAPALRQEIETALATELREVRTDDNPAGGWFLGVAGFLFAVIFLVMMVLILGLLFPPRR
jgi:hypothetical protein